MKRATALLLVTTVFAGGCSPVAHSDRTSSVPPEASHQASDPLRAPFGPRFPNSEEVISSLFRLQSPGLGFFIANQVRGKLDPSLDLVYVELPGGAQNRYFAVEHRTDGIDVVDDFVAPNTLEITRVHRHEGKLRYEQSNGTVVHPQRNLPVNTLR